MKLSSQDYNEVFSLKEESSTQHLELMTEEKEWKHFQRKDLLHLNMINKLVFFIYVRKVFDSEFKPVVSIHTIHLNLFAFKFCVYLLKVILQRLISHRFKRFQVLYFERKIENRGQKYENDGHSKWAISKYRKYNPLSWDEVTHTTEGNPKYDSNKQHHFKYVWNSFFVWLSLFAISLCKYFIRSLNDLIKFLLINVIFQNSFIIHVSSEASAP